MLFNNLGVLYMGIEGEGSTKWSNPSGQEV